MIKILIMDVDGTLTDGKIYMGSHGEICKAFDIKDGAGIKEILPNYGIVPVIITARQSDIVVNRCKELDIKEIHQNVRNKIDKIDQILRRKTEEDGVEYTYSDCAYIGDDIIDLQCINPIKHAGGITGCPADATDEIKNAVDIVCKKNGGCGAVREFIQHLTKGNIMKF